MAGPAAPQTGPALDHRTRPRRPADHQKPPPLIAAYPPALVRLFFAGGASKKGKRPSPNPAKGRGPPGATGERKKKP